MICPTCEGDGIERCTNPDHGFIQVLGFTDVGRIGCSCCGHDEKHRIMGCKCPDCNGTGIIEGAKNTEQQAKKREAMVQHDENREREIQLLVKEVLSGSVQQYDNPNGAYEWTCPYCCAKLEGGYETLLKGVRMDDLQHDHECAYIIAKGLKS